MRLDAIDWPAAVRAARNGGGLPPRAAAELLSLSALFAGSFSDAAGRVVDARAADPFNPAHPARLALLLMRFGDWSGAGELVEHLREQAPGFALPGYLWALAELRRDEPKRAANIAQEVATAHPTFPLARFLRAEALLKTPSKAARKHLSDVPRGDGHAPAWADLAAKMLLSGSDDVVKAADEVVKDAKRLPPASRAGQLVALLAETVGEPVEKVEERLGKVPAGSRAEEVLLLVLHDRYTQGTAKKKEKEAVKEKETDAEKETETAKEREREKGRASAAGGRRLYERYPDRKGVRRLYVALLTRLAVIEATAERFADALRLIETCLRLEPHETTHYQNRATLFTLMREADAYHTAWYELNRHQYRLAVLGRLSAADAARLAKPHRLFARQARFGPTGPDGVRADPAVFAEMIRPQDPEKTKVVVVNQARLDDDPELLRQWIHHHRAELVFSHLTLGPDPRRFLLHPESRRAARKRADGLTEVAKSLAVLVPTEGQLLAERITRGWATAADRVTAAYAPPADDPEVTALQAEYVETFADLALLCISWQPDGKRPDLAEEVLAFLTGIAPFFDEKALTAVVKAHPSPLPYPLRLLSGYVEELLGLDPARERMLTDAERGRVINSLSANLLVRQGFRTYTAYRDVGNAVPRAMAFVERARKLDPDDLFTQLTAARFFLMEGYYDDARSLIAQMQRSPKAKDPDTAEQLDELKKILDERRKADDKGKKREVAAVTETGGAPADRVMALEQEIERFPSAVQPYEELVEVYAAAGRFTEALEWSGLAMDRCAARDAQVRARSLHLEVLGLQALAERDQNAVRLYLAGVHRPALDILSALTPADRPYPLAYLLGRCLLAVNQPEPARQAFEAALAGCDHSAHRVVLRRLAADVDQAYLLIARRTVQDKLAAGAFEEAASEVGGMMARLRRPQAGFIDLARVHTAAATARLGGTAVPIPRPAGTDAPEWEQSLAEVYRLPTDRERARRLADLARQADPDSAAKVDQLLTRLDALDEQAGLADALARSGDLLREGKVTEALAALDDTPHAADPRVVRQRALLLLKLERFDAADAAAESVRESTAPVAREFLSAYPALAFRQRVTAACRLIKAGSDADALALLAAARPATDEDKVELGYCRGFCRAMAGFRLRRQGKKADAKRALTDAFHEIEPLLSAARAVKHTRLLELYATLDNDPDLASLGGL